MRLLATALAALMLAGCSWLDLGDEGEIKPATLSKFEQRFDLKRNWSVGIGKGVESYKASLRPAVSGARAFAADPRGRVTAINVTTGERIWRRDLELELSGGVAAGGELVVVADLDGTVVALDAESGSERWRAQVSSEVLAAPATDGEMVALQTIDNQLYLLEGDSGELRWRHDADAPILTVRGAGSPLISAGNVYAGFDSGKLIGFNGSNGSLLWESRLALPQGRTELERMVDIDGQPLLVGDILYSVSYQGQLGALSRGTGRTLWQQPASSFNAPAYGSDTLFVVADDDNVIAYSAGSGQQVWSNAQLFLRRLAAPITFEGYLAVADGEGYLHLIDQVDGQFVARTRVDSAGVSVAMVVAGSQLLVQANDGSLSSYSID